MPIFYVLLLPSMVCLFALAVLIFKHKWIPSDIYFVLFTLLAAIYFYVEACTFCPLLDMIVPISAIEIIGKVSGLCLIPIFYIWICRSWNKEPVPLWCKMLFLIPALMLGSQLTIFTMMGWDEANRFLYGYFIDPYLDAVMLDDMTQQLADAYVNICQKIFNVVLGLEAGLIFILLSWNAVLHYRNSESSVTSRQIMFADISWLVINVIIIARLCLGEAFLYSHLYVKVFLSVMTALAIFRILCSEVVMGILESTYWKPAFNDSKIAVKSMDSLRQSFEKMMVDDQLFKKPGITIEEVSKLLNTNRTYLGKLIKDSYSCTFRDYVNGKRIEEAKKLLLAQPDIKLDAVAESVGYADASHFSKRFKEIEGESPKAWLSSK